MRDIYLSKKFNIFCVGKVVDIYIEIMESRYLLHKLKLTSLFYLINLTMLICFAGTAIKSKKLLTLIIPLILFLYLYILLIKLTS